MMVPMSENRQGYLETELGQSDKKKQAVQSIYLIRNEIITGESNK